MEIDDEIYKDLIGICLTDNTKIPYILAKVSVNDIPKGIYKTIYTSIIDLYNLGVDIDIVTVSNRLLNTSKLKDIGGRNVINEIALNAPLPSKTKHIIDSVINQTTFRKVSSTLEEFKSDVETKSDINNITMEYCSRLNNIISGNMEDDKIKTISSSADEVINDLYDSRDKGCVGLRTGFSDIDYFLGGLQPNKLYIMGGRPSMGKSALAMNIAEYVSSNKNVLFISLEMDRKEYAQRLMFSRAGIDISCINTGKVSDEQILKVKEQKSYLDGLNLFIETKTPCKVSDIELSIINLQSTKGSCDLVVVDYLQLLSPSQKSSRNREVEVAEISRDLKSLAVKYKVPIIVLSQLSRALESREDKRPMLSDLRESGSIEQDADVVMFVYRDEYYNPDNPDARGCADVLLRKNRGGINNRDIALCWNASRVRFSERLKV